MSRTFNVKFKVILIIFFKNYHFSDKKILCYEFLVRHMTYIPHTTHNKEFTLWEEMRHQEACYDIHLWDTLHLCWSFSLKRDAYAIQTVPCGWAGFYQKRSRFISWVVVLPNTNTSKVFFHHGVIAVHGWCVLFLLFLPLLLRLWYRND